MVLHHRAGIALAKELSGRGATGGGRRGRFVRADGRGESPEKIYVETTEQRFNGVRRCC